MSQVKVTMKPNWVENIESGLKKAVAEMTVDIHKRATILAPIDTGALKNSGKISSISNGYKITFGDTRVPYARRQHFENRTKSGYLAKAGDSVARSDKSKYFHGKVNA